MPMVQRKFYLPVELYSELQMLSKVSKKTITQVLREAVVQGLKQKQKDRRNKSGAWRLLKLAEKAERENWGKNAPSDLAENHDKYLAEVLEKDLKRIHDQYR